MDPQASPDPSPGLASNRDNITQESATHAIEQNARSENNQDGVVTESYSAVLSNIGRSLKWCPTSESELIRAESDLLSVIMQPFKTYFVDIGDGWGRKSNMVRTLEMLPELGANHTTSANAEATESNTQPPKSLNKIPVVMVHGFAAGIGTWILNFDDLATSLNRKIYAFDIIGFARSTRAPFDLSGNVEAQFIDSIERWRVKMGLDRFILIGHSFGGYLSASYALTHPDRVPHVILADPWGFQDKETSSRPTYRFPIWVRVVTSIFQLMNPLAMLRASGPYGPRLIQNLRGDLREKFRPKLQDEGHKFLNYIYHCNVQTPTGESAFKSLCLPYGWPKNPMANRLIDLDPSVSLTFIYGSRSWIDRQPGEFLRECLPGRVTVEEIDRSGHHVYADKYTEFNNLVIEACSRVSD